ncbi:MAG: CoA pyrophosphatase [Armatimonadota bacterium]|nr:CoA pyrophosphatase [Armatimonadota bacterium]
MEREHRSPWRWQGMGLDLDEHIRQRLAARTRRVLTARGHRRAAVLIPLFHQEDDTYLLLTRRTEAVEHHKGQISFPGGAAEAGDPDLLATVLRETQEEVGIRPEDVTILGTLDDVETVVSGFIITPFVGRIPYPYSFQPNTREIREILTVPLSFFLQEDNLRTAYRYVEGRAVPLYFYYYGAHVIWGATARIIKGFVEVVFSG